LFVKSNNEKLIADSVSPITTKYIEKPLELLIKIHDICCFKSDFKA